MEMIANEDRLKDRCFGEYEAAGHLAREEGEREAIGECWNCENLVYCGDCALCGNPVYSESGDEWRPGGKGYDWLRLSPGGAL